MAQVYPASIADTPFDVQLNALDEVVDALLQFIDPPPPPKCFCKFCRVSLVLGLLFGVRFAVIGIVCCPWAIDIVSRHIDRFKPSLVPKFEQFLLPSTRLNISEEEIPILYHLEKNFPLIVSSVYLADLFIGGVAAIFFLFVTNLKCIRISCILWITFIFLSLAVYGFGLFLFIMAGEYLTIYVIDVVTIPVLFVLLIIDIRWLERLLREGFITFPKPVKDNATYEKLKSHAEILTGKDCNDPKNANDPECQNPPKEVKNKSTFGLPQALLSESGASTSLTSTAPTSPMPTDTESSAILSSGIPSSFYPTDTSTIPSAAILTDPAFPGGPPQVAQFINNEQPMVIIPPFATVPPMFTPEGSPVFTPEAPPVFTSDVPVLINTGMPSPYQPVVESYPTPPPPPLVYPSPTIVPVYKPPPEQVTVPIGRPSPKTPMHLHAIVPMPTQRTLDRSPTRPHTKNKHEHGHHGHGHHGHKRKSKRKSHRRSKHK